MIQRQCGSRPPPSETAVCLGFLARSVSSKSASLVNHPATHLFSQKQVADSITWHARDIIITQKEKCVIGY